MTELPDIQQLVPHEPPMLALEELLECESDRARARLTVRAENLFVRDGSLDTVVTLEYMAQAVAACLGSGAYFEGLRVGVGMVIACRSMEILRPRLAVGESLTIDVSSTRRTDWLSHFEGEVRTGEELVARASFTLVHGDEPPE